MNQTSTGLTPGDNAMPAFRYQHGDQPLDGFTIHHGLGRGGFGEVYFAISDSGRQVALKVLNNLEEIELRGIGHCMNLKSPHLVSIFDVKQNALGESFVIMEFVDGPSLRDLLDQSPEGLGATKGAFFLREIAKGLTHLHDRGVVHRDLKPHNVFYEDGYVKIGDYSLSKMISASHRSGHTMSVGTVHYMAPEISMGRYDARVDVYALGVMLFEMLTGQPPFVGESMGEILMKHMTSEPDLSQINEPFKSTVKKALTKDPEERFESAAAMVESVFGIEHICNSVSTFNPQELSVIADRIAAKAKIGGGPSLDSHDDRRLPRFENAKNRPHALHDSTSRIAGAEYLTSGEPLPVDAELIPDAEQTANSAIEHRSEEQLSVDSIPTVQRCTIAAYSLMVIAAYTSVACWAEYTPTNTIIGFGLILFLTMAAFSAAVAWLSHAMRNDFYPKSSVANRLIVCFAFTVFAGVVWSKLGNQHLRSSILFGVPFLIFDWPKLTKPKRQKRLLLYPIAVAGIFVLTIQLLITGRFEILGAAIISGVTLGSQILSPFQPFDSLAKMNQERK